jgi:hypothetical protein
VRWALLALVAICSRVPRNIVSVMWWLLGSTSVHAEGDFPAVTHAAGKIGELVHGALWRRLMGMELSDGGMGWVDRNGSKKARLMG